MRHRTEEQDDDDLQDDKDLQAGRGLQDDKVLQERGWSLDLGIYCGDGWVSQSGSENPCFHSAWE